ncbi:MAG: NUDIX domain-containing protein [Verrucomicrobiales bacterium]
MFRNIIFDWSGTLANDLPPVLDATNRLLEFHGRPHLSEFEFRETFRLPFKGFYDEVLPEVPLAELEVLFGEFFSASAAPVVLLPHAREFLEFCQSKGVRMFILSSARQDFLENQARELGVVGFFETIHAGVLDKRSALPGILVAHGLRPDETAFIGDMEHDVETALACGVHSVAVLTGYDPPAKLMKAGPEVVVADLSRLRRLLAGSGQPGHPVPTVGAAIFDEVGRVLLVKTWKWGDTWGIPGGKIERGETADSALRREIREETGLEIKDVAFVLYQDAILPPEFYREDHFLLLNFTAKWDTGEVVLNEEASEFVWLKPARALAELDLNQPTRTLLDHIVAH